MNELTARLDFWRARNDAARVDPESFDLDVLLGDYGRLLSAIADDLLKDHYKVTLYRVAIAEADRDGRINCGHTEADMENGRHELSGDSNDVLCLDQPEAGVCATCWDSGGERVEWPCSVASAISRALGVKTGSEGRGAVMRDG